MYSSAERAVERAIDTMRRNLSEPLTVDDLARSAMFSKFHFTRIFQRVTGVSPGRFLSAVRLQEAKQLLITTRLNVADISLRVGYNSVGTFSTRFTRSVGLSPTTYRRMGGYASQICTASVPEPGRTTVAGRVFLPESAHDRQIIFLGLFPERIPEGPPLRCTMMEEPGEYQFSGVPDGTWYLLCHSVTGDAMRLQQSEVMVATIGPIESNRDDLRAVDVRLKPVSKLDPPVLLALLDTRKAALRRARELTAAAS